VSAAAKIDSGVRYFFDTEFFEHAENGRGSIQLISIGVVSDDGRELYLENKAFDWEQPMPDKWLYENVRPHLRGPASTASRQPQEIAEALREFIIGDDIEIWAYVAAYDWVALMSVYGRLLDRPQGWPMFCRDLKQLIAERGIDKKELPLQDGLEHFALADARWNLAAWRYVIDRDLPVLSRSSVGFSR
jgi:hypothetical protein